MNRGIGLFFFVLLFGTSTLGDDHGTRGEENPSVGAEKGITEANHEDGFKLSPEAIRRFKVTTREVTSSAPFLIPKSAIYFGLQEQNVFRIRNGFFRRVDFKTVSKSPAGYVVSSANLAIGDQVVMSGVGFLRIAEIASTGEAVGHSH